MVLQTVRVKTFLCSFLLLALFNSLVKAEKAIMVDELYDKMRGMWIGLLIGNCAGRATEGRYSGVEPNPDSDVPWATRRARGRLREFLAPIISHEETRDEA